MVERNPEIKRIKGRLKLTPDGLRLDKVPEVYAVVKGEDGEPHNCKRAYLKRKRGGKR